MLLAAGNQLLALDTYFWDSCHYCTLYLRTWFSNDGWETERVFTNFLAMFSRFAESGYWPAAATGSAVNKAGKGNDLIGAGLVDLYDSESPELSATVRSVSLHLEQSLRAAKKVHLSCGEVLLPPDLLTRVARGKLQIM